MVNRWRIVLIPLLVFILWGSGARAATVQAVADRDRIAAGESLQLQLRVDGSPDGEPDLSALEKNWEILNRSQSSQVQIVNGSFSRSVVYSLTLMPRGHGTVMVPAVCFGKDCSLPLPIEISKTPAKGSGSNDALLLETEVSPHKIVTQGQLLFKVSLLRRVDLLDGQLNEPQPTGMSAVVKKLGDDRSYETRRNGQLYQVIERDYAIFPQGVGTMQIPALQFDGSIAAGRTRFDPFGQQGKRVRRTSQPLQVEVLSLPADIGRRSWIPANSLDLQDDWQKHPPKLTVGEPATRTLHLGASGVMAAQLPELKPEMPAEFKTYPDQPKRKDLQSSSGITGVLEQKIAIVPTRAGKFTLPAIDLDWWDVTSGRWQKAHLDAVDLEVAPSTDAALTSPASPAPPPVVRPSGEPSVAENSLPAAPAPASPAAVHPLSGFWPWLSLALGLGWLLTLVLLWRLWRRAQPSPKPSVVDLQPTEKSARKAVVQAARRNDPQTTRQALRVWTHILWPAAQGSAYEQLAQAADPILRQELDALDQCLYGVSGSEWDGQALADLIANWQATSNAVITARLPDLYP
ncbi:BatD family protein [Geopsychrobacter electrodiphilus]|uniref:BatD family protein n=1 Tax=Geopsychrobacter electrodiphilus TaxID=225196 RepID=UPI00036989B4|nr:BatD family protein [Geopsychrobacter electrodiphilus]